MNKKEFLDHLATTFSTALEIATKKNSDYSGENENPFKNFLMSEQVGVDPARAILVRISDKLSRISNLLDKDAQVIDERIEDTILDLVNYSAILKAYLYAKRNNQ